MSSDDSKKVIWLDDFRPKKKEEIKESIPIGIVAMISAVIALIIFVVFGMWRIAAITCFLIFLPFVFSWVMNYREMRKKYNLYKTKD